MKVSSVSIKSEGPIEASRHQEQVWIRPVTRLKHHPWQARNEMRREVFVACGDDDDDDGVAWW